MASSTSLRRTNSNRTNNMAVAGVNTATTASSETLISISDNNKKPTGTGKENPRSISRTRNSVIPQKPRQLPIPAIEKPTKEFNDSKVRRSTSSVPRGRSSSPNDFTRILSDFRNNKDNRDRMPRVSVSDNHRSTNKTLENVGRNDIVGYGKGKDFSSSSRVLDKFQPKKANFCSNLKDNEKSMRPKDGVTESLSSNVKPVERSFDVFKRLSSSKGGEVNLSSGLIKVGGKVGNSSATEGFKEKGNIVVNAEDKLEESRIGISRVFVRSGSTGSVGVNLKPQGSKGWNSSKFVDSVKEKGNAEEEKGVKLSGKYQSKLHEKLAFLEGKVKRIASDIKRTKDMLDMNNPDGSKVIISDIQDKISGIEKAMVHVITDDSSSLIASKAVESLNSKCLEHSEIVQVGQLKNSVKRLNHEDIEARLFPHHKLLKGQTSWSTSSASGQSDRPHLPEVTGDSKLENVPLSPIDDNPIALEFLASLHKGKPKEITQNDYVVEYYEVHEMDGAETSASQDKSKAVGSRNRDEDATLIADEVIEDIENQENKPTMALVEEIEDMRVDQLHEIGRKASTGGWFVSEGESVLLAHEDGSCSFYDITNSEEKAEYNPPAGLSPNLWGDCWLIRAAGADGCSGRYVVAASSGNALESGFCSWDFYTRDVRAFHLEDATVKSSRTVLGPLPSIGLFRRSASSTIMVPENRQWWYRPCGPLLVSTASGQKSVKVYDIRDGDEVMKWELQKPVAIMDYSSPLQWRDRGKVVLAEAEAESVSLWDVNSLTPQALLSVSSNGRQISALHVHNTDAELGGGVRRRVSSVEGNDGVFCTQDSICVLDFRVPSGVGLKVSKHGLNVQSISSRGDSIFLGCTDGQLSTVSGKAHSRIQQYSLRKGTLLSTYALPESNAHFHYTAISQVWGNTNVVMGVCGLGLFVFDTLQQEEGESSSLAVDYMKTQQTRDVIGPNDLYSPSFDYSSSRVLVISRDRPAFWRYLL